MKINTTLLRLTTGASLLATVIAANAATPATKTTAKSVVPQTASTKAVAKAPVSKTTRTGATAKSSTVSASHKKHSSRMIHHTSTKSKAAKASAKKVKG